MTLFGNQKRRKSPEVTQHGEHEGAPQDVHGSIFRRLVHRTSSLSAGKESTQPRNDVHRSDIEPHSLSRRSSSVTRKCSHTTDSSPADNEPDNTGDTISANDAGIPHTDTLETITSPVPNSTACTSEDLTAENGLTREDARRLFSGAPHFKLEKSTHHGKSLPQVFFPWDNNLDIADLIERRLVRHESFALVTLHAHLPIRDRLERPPRLTEPLIKEDAWKRPSFEIGMFEVPNMLEIDGREPGTVAMRHFLELPIADKYRAKVSQDHVSSTSPRGITHTPSGGTPKALRHKEGFAVIGKHAPWQDRLQLIREGPQAWKRVGVREIGIKTLSSRLVTIGSFHDGVVKEGWRCTAMDLQDSETFYTELFTDFLYPPQNVTNGSDPPSMKVQIETLLEVLTTPGAWSDLSIVESRLHLGQLLWDPTAQHNHHVDNSSSTPSTTKHWLLVQVLLSIELSVRLDTVLRSGFSQKSAEYHVSGEEIRVFSKLRNRKLDWDLVLARRFLDYFYVKPSCTPASDQTMLGAEQWKHGITSRSKQSPDSREEEPNCIAWDCLALPRQPRLQLDGLLRFARGVDWPNYDEFEDRMLRTLGEVCSAAPELTEAIYGSQLQRPFGRQALLLSSESTSLVDCDPSKLPEERRTVRLQPATATQPGSWLSRSWLTGLVLPGEIACDLLMSTLLENEPEILKEIGEVGFLHGGFILDCRSWWSKSCIVGRVFAPYDGGVGTMGWISTPGISPVLENDTPVPNQWVYIESIAIPELREKTRIHDGVKVGIESSPLGTGQGKVMAKEFTMPGMSTCRPINQVDIRIAQVRLQASQDSTKSSNTVVPTGGIFTAFAQFIVKESRTRSHSQVNFTLIYDVYFVSAHPCRVPNGVALHATRGIDQHLTRENGEPLRSHPLHRSYRYAFKSILDLANFVPPDYTDLHEPVWVVDARGSQVKEVFARAWCSQMARHALVSRIGRTCLSCSIREARAIEVAIIIRVGESEQG